MGKKRITNYEEFQSEINEERFLRGEEPVKVVNPVNGISTNTLCRKDKTWNNGIDFFVKLVKRGK